jgi:hypothetical protein
MATLGRIGQLRLAAAAVSLSIVMVQPAVGAPTVKGDAVAWAEVVAALKKQYATAFRGKSAETGTSMIIEFAPHGSQHVILQGYPDMIAPEIITVGNTSWKRDHNGKWNCADPLRLSPADTVPLWDRKGEVSVTRIPDRVIGGMPTHGYAYTQTFESAGIPLTTKEKLYVGVQTGLPLRQMTETGKTTSTFDYYDYGAKITITPPCS